MQEALALAEMDVFMALNSLETVEINRELPLQSRSLTSYFSPQPSFYELLGIRFPALRRIFVVRRQYEYAHRIAFVLWEKHEGWWDRRTVPRYDYWDLLNDNV